MLADDEAWDRVRDEFPEARYFSLCPDVNLPCAPYSAYLRERPDRFWFVLHTVAPTCTGDHCPPDLYHYIEVAAWGTVADQGTAAVRLEAGRATVLAGRTRWGVPESAEIQPVPAGGTVE
jgi:hypothetical protein